MKQSEIIQFKQWDSEFFGYKVGTVDYEQIRYFEIQSFIKLLKQSDYNLVYLISNKKIVEKDKRLLINISDFYEEKIVFEKKIKDFNCNFTENIQLAESGVLNADLLSLAYQSGIYSRFRLDTGFKSGEFSKLYKTWIEKSIKGEIADAVYVYNNGTKPQGLITLALSNQNQCVNIGLISVLEEERRKNIGCQLLGIAENYARKNKIMKIKVATQAVNTLAVKFYEKNGFAIVERTEIFHLRPHRSYK